MSKQKLIVAVTVLFIMVSGIYYCVCFGESEEAVFVVNGTEVENNSRLANEDKEDCASESITETQNIEEPEKLEKTMIYVHICGQVNRSGVYCLEEDGRVMELVELAGGFTDRAARDSVNLAQKLSDGQRIYIPDLEEVKGGLTFLEVESEGHQGLDTGKVNINTANKDTLMTLTGIGEAKAEAIIRYREEHGGFQSIEEIKGIEGIKDGVYNKIKDEIEI